MGVAGHISVPTYSSVVYQDRWVAVSVADLSAYAAYAVDVGEVAFVVIDLGHYPLQISISPSNAVASRIRWSTHIFRAQPVVQRYQPQRLSPSQQIA